MFFQMLYGETGWQQYVINALIVALGRSLDILSTLYVTRELKLETNKFAKRLGWKGMIIMQAPVIILGALDFYFAFFIFIWSLLLFANNIEGSWYVKEVGEDNYHKELKTSVKKSKTWQIVLGELSYIMSFTIAGVFIIVFLFIWRDLIAVFFIALALICEGVLASFRSMSYLISLKKEKSENRS